MPSMLCLEGCHSATQSDPLLQLHKYHIAYSVLSGNRTCNIAMEKSIVGRCISSVEKD